MTHLRKIMLEELERRSHDLGMILAWHGNGVSDGEHSADVMKRTDGVGQGWPEGRTLEVN